MLRRIHPVPRIAPHHPVRAEGRVSVRGEVQDREPDGDAPEDPGRDE